MLDRIKVKLPRVQLGALSNACGAYVEAVLRVNHLWDNFGVALGDIVQVGNIVITVVPSHNHPYFFMRFRG